MGAEQSSAAGSSAASAASLSKDSEPAVETPTVSSSVMKPVAELAPGQTPSALVVVGPSGVGKGTLIKLLMDGSDRFGFSTSHTTRQPRPGEKVATGRRWGERSLSPRTKGTTVYQMIDPHFPTPIRSMGCITTSQPRSSSARRSRRASSSNTLRCMAGVWEVHGDDRVLHGRSTAGRMGHTEGCVEGSRPMRGRCVPCVPLVQTECMAGMWQAHVSVLEAGRGA